MCALHFTPPESGEDRWNGAQNLRKPRLNQGAPVRRKSRKVDGSLGRELEQRLTEALEQQTATGDILRVMSQSQTDVRPQQ